MKRGYAKFRTDAKGLTLKELETRKLDELNNAQQTIGLSPEEETELLVINNYLTEPELRTIADFHLKTNSAKKGEIETEMKADRNPADQTKNLDWNLYGDVASPTEAGIKKYYFEKLAGINHSYAKQKATESKPTSKEEGF
ncbi:1059_t:CDS:2 [Entrophospora sp. SA101]|nr:1059_t:CDS:2 [Entrophospora sp. SA101]CAJ0880114.1 2423_t:CDS:2 [Entrophospora sp. SA101]